VLAIEQAQHGPEGLDDLAALRRVARQILGNERARVGDLPRERGHLLGFVE
jgi:hypothetical protein